MTIQTTTLIENDILTYVISAAGIAGGNCSLRLFTNDVATGLTPTQMKAVTNASFNEASFAGYAAVTLTAASWAITGTLPIALNYAMQTFERSSTGAAQTVRGYWIRRVSDSRLMWWEQYPGPLTFEFLGDRHRITPRLPLRDGDD